MHQTQRFTPLKIPPAWDNGIDSPRQGHYCGNIEDDHLTPPRRRHRHLPPRRRHLPHRRRHLPHRPRPLPVSRGLGFQIG